MCLENDSKQGKWVLGLVWQSGQFLFLEHDLNTKLKEDAKYIAC